MLPTIMHVTVGMVGCVLVWIALFLTETEEGKLQNRMEELWIRVDDLSRISMRKESALIQQSSRMLSIALDRVFGPRLLSWKSLSTSVGFSMLSLLLSVYLVVFLTHRSAPSLRSVIILVFFVILSFAPGRVRYCIIPLLLFLIAVMLVAQMLPPHALDPSVYSKVHSSKQTVGILGLEGIIGGGTVSDILAIILIRWILKKSSTLTNVWTLIGFIFLNLLIGIALLSPFLVVRYRNLDLWTAFAVGTAGSNLLDALLSALLLLVLAAALLHRGLWPIVSRPIYSAQRFGLVRHPKSLTGLAALCFMFAWPHSPVAALVTKLLHLTQ